MSTFFYHEKTDSRFVSFEAVKDAIMVAMQPITRQIKRSVKNGLPITAGQEAEILTQVDELEYWLHGLKMVDNEAPVGRRAIARATRQIKPGDKGYELLPPPPAKKP